MPRETAQKITLPNGTEIYAPLVKVTIEIGNRGLAHWGMVDSGADDILVPAALVAALGVDFDQLPAGALSQGAGKDPFETRPCDGVVRYGKYELCRKFKVPQPGGPNIVLLGRAEVFTKFIIKFHWYKNPPVFDMDPAAPSAGPAAPRSPRTSRRGR